MSAIFDAKDYVYTLLTGAFEDVTWGPPTKSDDTNVPTGEHIFLTGQSTIEVPDEELGLGRYRREHFDVVVVIDVYQDGDDERAVEARCDELYDEAVGLLDAAARTHFGGNVTQVSGWLSNRAIAPYGSGWRCQITLEQACVNVVQTN